VDRDTPVSRTPTRIPSKGQPSLLLWRRGPPSPHQLGEGVATIWPRRGTAVVFSLWWSWLHRAVAPVHRSGWRKADVLLWRPAPSTLFLGGGGNNHHIALCRHGRAGRPLVGVAWVVHYLLVLSFRQHRIMLSIADLVPPLMRSPSRGGLQFLSGLSSFSSGGASS
jgi:hypothetical protein